MKTLITFFFICVLGCSTACSGQTKKTVQAKKYLNTSKKKAPSKPMNLVDEQMKILGGMFSMVDTGDEPNIFAESDNYLELVDKIDAPEETKQYMREQYKLYELSLDPKKKDSLGILVDKMLQKTMTKSKPNN